jgi:hypothetical protein
MDEWRRRTLRHLIACRDLALISVWHPTFLALLVEPLSDMFPGASTPAALHARLWPRLRVISCWADAGASRPAAELAGLFPHARIQPKGLIATEGFVSLPLTGRDGAALAVRSHFFEFLEDDGCARLAHQLTLGSEYSVVITTGGGCLRYRLHDRVRVAGFERQCPLLHFVGKEHLASDWFGEKLNERQVRAALDALELNARFSLVACEGRSYTLFVETMESDGRLLAAAAALETSLQENIHYRYCRRLGQLTPLRVCRLARGGQAAWLRESLRRGRQLGAVKPSALSPETGWMAGFARAGAEPTPVRPEACAP